MKLVDWGQAINVCTSCSTEQLSWWNDKPTDRRKESRPKSWILMLARGDILIGICQHCQEYMLSHLWRNWNTTCFGLDFRCHFRKCKWNRWSDNFKEINSDLKVYKSSSQYVFNVHSGFFKLLTLCWQFKTAKCIKLHWKVNFFHHFQDSAVLIVPVCKLADVANLHRKSFIFLT